MCEALQFSSVLFFPARDSRDPQFFFRQSSLYIWRPTHPKKRPSSRECPIAARDTMQNALSSVCPPPTNWKLISLVAIVRSSRRFRMSKSPVRKTVSSFKLDNLSALRSEWKLRVRAREKSEKRRNVRTVGNCIYSPRNVLSDIIRPYVCVKTLSLKYCATVYFNVSIAVILAGKRMVEWHWHFCTRAVNICGWICAHNYY